MKTTIKHITAETHRKICLWTP